MSRLAAYMADLSSLLGEEHAVHFVRLRKGSTSIVHRVANESFPTVRERAARAKQPDAPAGIRQAYDRIERRLRRDNARIASLKTADAKLLEFRINRTGVAYPSVARYGHLQGIVTRMGGAGEWVPVHLEDLDGTVYMCEARKDKSKELSRYYLGGPIRVEGSGRWVRQDGGGWDLESFRIGDFVPLNDEDLRATLARLRSIPAAWKTSSDNPLEVIAKIRNGER